MEKRRPSHLWFRPALLQTVIFHRSTLLTGFLITTVSYREEALVSGRNDHFLFKHKTIKRKAMQRSWKANQIWWNISNNAVKEKPWFWKNVSVSISEQNDKNIKGVKQIPDCFCNKFMLGECTAADHQDISTLDFIFLYVQTAPSPNQVEDSSDIKNSTHIREHLISKGSVSIHTQWRC